MDRTVVLVCPCCASPVDARTGPAVQQITCVACEQVWDMVVDDRRITEHSLT